MALWNCFLSPATDMVRGSGGRLRVSERGGGGAGQEGRAVRRARRAAACLAAAGAVGAGARSGAGRGLVRRDTLTSGAGDAAS